MALQHPKLLITGATGYIGGDVLHAILETFPHLEPQTTCLLRRPESGALLQKSYPSLTFIYGDLKDHALLASLAADADIILHCASIEDVSSSRALRQGLARRERPGPAFWICTSGTDILASQTINHASYGEAREEVYDDVDGLGDVLNLPVDAPHKEVEDIQRGAASPLVNVAIVCTPCIYGQGRGHGNRQSIQLPDLARSILKTGKAFQIGRGLSRWPNVHIHDSSDIYIRLVGEALAGGGMAA